MATNFLSSALMDVRGLNRDCRIEILTPIPDAQHFVPLFWIRWYKGTDVIAMVELFEPTHSLRQLHVTESQYILREPLEIRNLEGLLVQTNAITQH
jgi:hypothetical protein